MNSLRVTEKNMIPRLTYSFVSAAVLAITATGLAFKADPAVAQQVQEGIEEVVVEAPIAVRQVGRTNIGAKIELIGIERRVTYADLDLSKHADVIELETRVEAISKETCKNLFPLDLATERRRCIDKAINGAEEQVHAAIVAANREMPTYNTR